jgi:hypothetical protein
MGETEVRTLAERVERLEEWAAGSEMRASDVRRELEALRSAEAWVDKHQTLGPTKFGLEAMLVAILAGGPVRIRRAEGGYAVELTVGGERVAGEIAPTIREAVERIAARHAT